jgi:hypothetical protein
MTTAASHTLWVIAPPHPSWWKAVTKAARARIPFAEVSAYLEAENVGGDPTVPGLDALEHVDEDLPRIDLDEALWLIGKHLELEGDTGREGIAIHVLQWLALTHHYAAGREPFEVLRQLVGDFKIREATLAEHGVGFSRSQLRWPLITTEKTIRAIDDAAVRREFPAFAAAHRQATAAGRGTPQHGGVGWVKRLLGMGGA